MAQKDILNDKSYLSSTTSSAKKKKKEEEEKAAKRVKNSDIGANYSYKDVMDRSPTVVEALAKTDKYVTPSGTVKKKEKVTTVSQDFKKRLSSFTSNYQKYYDGIQKKDFSGTSYDRNADTVAETSAKYLTSAQDDARYLRSYIKANRNNFNSNDLKEIETAISNVMVGSVTGDYAYRQKNEWQKQFGSESGYNRARYEDEARKKADSYGTDYETANRDITDTARLYRQKQQEYLTAQKNDPSYQAYNAKNAEENRLKALAYEKVAEETYTKTKAGQKQALFDLGAGVIESFVTDKITDPFQAVTGIMDTFFPGLRQSNAENSKFWRQWNAEYEKNAASRESTRSKISENAAKLNNPTVGNVANFLGQTATSVLSSFTDAAVLAGMGWNTVADLSSKISAIGNTGNGIKAGMETISNTLKSVPAKAIENLSNPYFVLSWMQEFNRDYEQALKETGDTATAGQSALISSFIKGQIEVGFGEDASGIQGDLSQKKWYTTAAEEANEEFVQGLSERTVQKLTYDYDKPVVSLKEGEDAILNPYTSVEEILGGALGAMMHSAGYKVSETVANNLQRSGIDNKTVQTVLNAALQEMDRSDPAFNKTRQLAIKAGAGKAVSTRQLNNAIYNGVNARVQKESKQQRISTAENKIDALDISSESKETAKNIAKKFVNGVKLTEEENKAVSVNEEVNAALSSDFSQNVSRAENEYQATTITEDTEYAERTSSDGVTRLAGTGEAVTVASVESVTDDGTEVKLKNGRTADIGDIEFASEGEAIFWNSMASMDDTATYKNGEKVSSVKVTAADANRMIKAVVNTVDSEKTLAENGGIIAAEMTSAYRIGRAGLPATALNRLTHLTEFQRNVAYSIGKARLGNSNQANLYSKANARQEAIDKGRATVQKSSIDKGTVVIEDGTFFAEEGSEKRARQDQAVKVMTRLAKALNLKVYLYSSTQADLANKTEKAKNGWYDPNDGSIHIDLNAGENSEGMVLFTASHELSHFIRDWSPTKFMAMTNFLVKEYGGGLHLAELATNQMEKARLNGQKMTYTQAVEEVFCDSFESMLVDERVLDKIEALRKQDATLVGKIAEFFRGVARKLKGYETIKSSAEYGLAYDLGKKFDRFADMFAEAAAEAGENFGKAGEYSSYVESTSDIKPGSPMTAGQEIATSLRRNSELMQKAIDFNEGTRFVGKDVMKTASKVRNRIRKYMIENADKLKLPEDIEGNTLFGNKSYGLSGENSTVCIRSLTMDRIVAMMEEELGRPLTINESIWATQNIGNYTDAPPCAYCYVAADRMAFNDGLSKAFDQKDIIFDCITKGMNIEDTIERAKNVKNPTKTELARIRYWYSMAQSGEIGISRSDVAGVEYSDGGVKKKRDKLTSTAQKEEYDKVISYARSASHAKKRVSYTAYNGNILGIKPENINALNRDYGFRMYSYSDFSPAFILENMQMVTDAAARGLKMLAYTKELDFVRIFAPTGMNINISVYAYMQDGQIAEDAMQGAAWKEAQELRKKYPNVGITLVATNDAIVNEAKTWDWVDVVLPYHSVFSGGSHVAKYYGFQDYKAVQADQRTEKGQKAKDIKPPVHQNDLIRYADALIAAKESPRFPEQIQGFEDYRDGRISAEEFRRMNPYYMKFVNETRQSSGETQVVQPVFDEAAAIKSLQELEKRGGYDAPLGKDASVEMEIAQELAEKIRNGENKEKSFSTRNIRYLSKDNLSEEKYVLDFSNDRSETKLYLLEGDDYFNAEISLYSQYQSGVANKNTFFKNTVAEFKKISRRPSRKPDYVSYSRSMDVSSEYWYTDKGVIRGSKHWGLNIRSCDWKIEGLSLRKQGVNHTNKIYGFANWEDFVYKTNIEGSRKDSSGLYKDFSDAKLTSFADNDTENNDIRYSTRNRNIRYNSDEENKAIEIFGVTDDFKEAGYILTNGEMLRFTDNGNKGIRNYDHRAIGKVYGKDIDLSKNHGFDMYSSPDLEKFVEGGAIRFDAGDRDLAMDSGLQLSGTVPISLSQEQTIRDFIEWRNEQEESYVPDEKSLYEYPLALVIEFGGNADYSVDSHKRDLDAWGVPNLRYEGKKIYPLKVISDIRKYYETGEIAEQGEIGKFRSTRNRNIGIIENLTSDDIQSDTEAEAVIRFQTLTNEIGKLEAEAEKLDAARRNETDPDRQKELDEEGYRLSEKISDLYAERSKLAGNSVMREIVNRVLESNKTQRTKKAVSLEEENRRLKKKLTEAERQLKASDKRTLSEADVQKLAGSLIRETQAKGIMRDDIKGDLNAIADEILNGDGNENAEDMAISLADKLIAKASEMRDDSADTRHSLIQYLKSANISIPKENKGDIDPDVRKKNVWWIHASGTPVNEIWGDINERFPGLFGSEITNPADMISDIVGALEGLQPQSFNPYAGIESEARYEIARAIIGGIVSEDVRQNLPTLRDKLNTALQENKQYASYIRRQERRVASLEGKNATLSEGRKKVSEEYRRKLADLKKKNKEQTNAKVMEIREAERKKTEAVAERYKERISETQKARKRREIVGKIKRITDDLNKRLENPQKNKYVPKQFAKDLVTLLEHLDVPSIDEVRVNGLIKAKSENIKKIIERLERIQNDIYKATSIEGRNILQEQYDKVFAELQKADNTLTKYYDRKNSIGEKVLSLSAMYDRFAKSTNPDDRIVYDGIISDMLAQLYQDVEGTPVSLMSNEQLETVYKTMRAVHKVITEAIKLKNSKIEKDAYEASMQMLSETASIDKKQTSVLSKWNIAQLSALRAFELFGNYAKNSMWVQAYEMLNDGQLKATRIRMEMANMFDGLIRDKRFKTLRDLVDIGLKDENGNAIMIPKDFALAVYMDLQNEDNTRHVRGGGYEVIDVKEWLNGNVSEAYGAGIVMAKGFSEELSSISKEIRDAESRKKNASDKGEDVTDIDNEIDALKESREDVIRNAGIYTDDILKKVTDIVDGDPYLKSWVDTAIELLDDKSKKYLNETTMDYYGFEKANVPHYFPIRSSRFFIDKSFDTMVSNISLENSGFMKDRVESANPIMLSGLTDTLARQIDRVSNYSGLMIPMKNFEKMYGKMKAGYETSLKKTLNDKFGKTADEYISNLMADLTGSRSVGHDIISKVFLGLRSPMAQGVLSANLRVALSQTASFPTAAAEIGWKPIAKALAKGGKNNRLLSRADKELIAKYSPLLWDRMQGYDSMSVKDLPSYNDKKMLQSARGIMGWIQAMDGATVGRLWYAAQYYIDDTASLEKGTDAYYQAVAKVFNRIVENTQPDYQTLQRPDILRSNNGITKMLTMFMTQRMQNYNIIESAFMNAVKTKQQFVRSQNGVTKADVKVANRRLWDSISSQLVAGAILVIFKAIADAILHRSKSYRDDDTGELDAESVMKQLAYAFADSEISNLLLGSEMYSLINALVTRTDYEGVSINGVDGITDIVNNVIKIEKAISDISEINTEIKTAQGGIQELRNSKDEKLRTIGNNVYYSVKSLSSLTGIPFGNISGIVEGLLYHVQDIRNGEALRLEAGYDYTDEQKKNNLSGAYATGDQDEIAKWESELGDNKAASYRREYLKSDPRIDEANTAWYTSDYDTYESLVNEIVSEGVFSEEEVTKAVKGSGGTWNAKSVAMSMQTGEKTADIIQSIRDDATDGLKGKDAREADKNACQKIRSAITSYWKPIYLESSGKERVAIRKKMLATGLYESYSDIEKQTNKWVNE